jgi:peptidoglycan/xylan/chitin deacetylase (PgdA/CDA1 family)
LFLSTLKRTLFNFPAVILFSSGTLSLINRFVNSFQTKNNEAGTLSFPFIKKRTSRNLQILGYHRVNDEEDPLFPAVPVRVFERQMEYLAANCCPISLDEAVEGLQKSDLPNNAVVVTFDDGYRDNYVHAFPILKNLSIPATIFLATDAIGTGRVLWHDKVFCAFRATQVAFLEGLHNQKKYPLRTLEQKILAQSVVLRFLRSLNRNERRIWVDRLLEILEVPRQMMVADLMLSWDDVKVMYQNGISFGSHTVTHPILSKLSPGEAHAEICRSKAIIEEQLQTRVTTFAYPGGRRQEYDDTTKALVRNAGYLCGVTAMFGTNENGHDLYELKRGKPWEEFLPAFAAKLNWYKFCS